MNLSDWIGFTGVAILLIAFLLNLLKRLSTDSPPYILMNMIGAGLACVASIMINYIPFIILEAAWTLVSVVTLIRIISSKKTI
jgi:hypothetical protein